MQKCPNCSHPNRVGVLLCEKCGTNLITGRLPKDVDTRSLGESEQKSLAETDPTVPIRAFTTETERQVDEFPHGGTLWLEVEGSAKSVQLPLTTHNREIVLGRRDPATGALPDVDLTPFAGYRMGVSRRHCVLRYTEGKYLDLFDQGSSNGTYLNGLRVEPHQPYRLNDGDRLRLGQITLRIHFEARAVPATTPKTAPSSGLPVAIQQPPKATEDKTSVQRSLQNAVAKLAGEREAKPANNASEATINLNADEAKAVLEKKQSEASNASASADTTDKAPLPTEVSTESSSDSKASSANDDKPDKPSSSEGTKLVSEAKQADAAQEVASTEKEEKKTSVTDEAPTQVKPAIPAKPEAETSVEPAESNTEVKAPSTSSQAALPTASNSDTNKQDKSEEAQDKKEQQEPPATDQSPPTKESS
ncbi:MAG: hypothetical protein CUN55_03875 [Phototrophicales bacterium]|nr:MAG: hypothetical protein CUN55_03875 [Phototrophicales bacterium]